MSSKYPKNYVKEVIARIDFLSPVNSLTKEINSNVSSAIKQIFPIAEPTDVITKQLYVKPDEEKILRTEYKQWNFFDKKRLKQLTVDHECMFISLKIFKAFEDIQTAFSPAVDILYDSYKGLQVKRLGLRFVNHVKMQGEDPFSWEKYLNSNLLAIFTVPEDKKKITRAIHILELSYDEFNVRFQYGMHNPDYPAPIKEKIFLLDYDAYTQGVLLKDEIKTLLPTYYTEMKKLFEKSIMPGLKEKMNAAE